MLFHPSARTDEAFMEQVRGLGLYEKAMAGQEASRDEKTPSQRHMRAKRLRRKPRRQDLAKEFQAALAEAGSVEARLQLVEPTTTAKTAKTGKTPGKQKLWRSLAFRRARQVANFCLASQEGLGKARKSGWLTSG